MAAERTAAEGTAVLYSGGTDSTLAAALMAERFQRLHLLTFDRFGLFATGNTRRAALALQEKFGPERVTHEIFDVERLFRHVSYESYLQDWARHGFFLLSTCGLCKLAMHARAVVYCLDHGLRHACDGANKGMDLFPDQMSPVLEELRALYKRFGIEYENPVYDYEPPAEGDFIEKQNLALVKPLRMEAAERLRERDGTTGQRLLSLGLAPAANVKGTPYDRERQPRCFQFILFNIFAKKYYLAAHSMEEYREGTVRFFREKIRRVGDRIEAYARDGSHAALLKG